MIPGSFEYVRPTSVEEAIAALVEHGDDAKVLAGGHSLLPLMKLRLAMPAVLIDISRIPGLSYVRVDGDEVAIGAGTRHHELEKDAVAAAEVPILPYVASQVGDPQVRHRGTIGGTVAHSDPASDLPTALLALGGTVVVQGPNGRRSIPLTDFWLGFFETALAEDELIVEIRVPRTGSAGWAYEKFTRRANDWPIVAAAAVGSRGGGAGGPLRVALANMAGAVVRATATEEALARGASIEEAAALADQGTSPGADMHADQEYRRHLARLLTRRALEKAAGAPAAAA
ncbi:carbon-monoxide dehydrogenase medium subunit [Geodermatophilus siccatus]|uniref:Carbon-monoxide dehydrogenase medium subunit n=1 Tax=Geodermatophilus siccatus TaxID=1137991 RepID=A0A1H0AYK8_9ACTN|nr:xanthine dehydrogenase family protein subunit M [Geodermatophilus siccatus]SDN38532.1 carbon-monoxide dehydrogenase medium subunit [Geodermatophilus siccatus]